MASVRALSHLGVLEDADRSLGERMAALALRLPNSGLPSISQADGELSEWADGSYRSADEGHRHFSHLYALYPGRAISPQEHPKHFEAARRSLTHRLRAGGGHVGWSSAWAIGLWARLHDGGLAHAALRYTLHEFASDALLGLHPILKGKAVANGRGVRCITCVGRRSSAGNGMFQLDANGGTIAGLVEMLLHSRRFGPDADGVPALCSLTLLPALPPAWPDGTVVGLRARGGWQVDMRWRSGSLQYFVLREAPHEAEGRRVQPESSLRICCSHVVCGASAEALTAAAGSPVSRLELDTHAVDVWSWAVRVRDEKTGMTALPWSMRL